ncbi:MAG TPA: hypothetical protein VLQ45_29855 [Thermoanaerobaculia bacterium]|nr:hypothetical protein [Thermoanaerobaculia bacterium]
MSSFTVQLIFFGLIGFVPNEGGQNGMTALMVDPASLGISKCRPKHKQLVLLLDGECTPEQECLERADTDRLQLQWELDKEDLEIFGNQRQIEFRLRGKQSIFGNDKELPSYDWQAASYSWVPSIDLLTGGYGHVREAFVRDGRPKPPVQARFTVRGGQTSACHLIHEPVKYSDPQEEDRKVVLFHYDNLVNRSCFQQAVADGVKVEFEVEGSFMNLYSWSFTPSHEHRNKQQELKRSVRLSPSPGSDTVTLIVANVPRYPHRNHDYQRGEDDDQQCPPHSDIFFDLLAREPPVRPTRRATNITRSVNPGSCEDELTALIDLLGPRAEGPLKSLADAIHPRALHSRTFCDGMGYP